MIEENRHSGLESNSPAAAPSSYWTSSLPDELRSVNADVKTDPDKFAALIQKTISRMEGSPAYLYKDLDPSLRRDPAVNAMEVSAVISHISGEAIMIPRNIWLDDVGKLERSLLDNPKVAKTLVELDPRALNFLSQSVGKDPEISNIALASALKFVEKSPQRYLDLHPSHQNNTDVLNAAKEAIATTSRLLNPKKLESFPLELQSAFEQNVQNNTPGSVLSRVSAFIGSFSKKDEITPAAAIHGTLMDRGLGVSTEQAEKLGRIGKTKGEQLGVLISVTAERLEGGGPVELKVSPGALAAMLKGEKLSSRNEPGAVTLLSAKEAQMSLVANKTSSLEKEPQTNSVEKPKAYSSERELG